MTEPSAQETFDPYYKWLGISPKDQPPHHYRLLAIDVFEGDQDVIAAAADKQMAFVRSFQSGKNAQFSQKLLNEIAAARVCLLNTAKKAEYDLLLHNRLNAGGKAAGRAVPPPFPEAPPSNVETEMADDSSRVDLDVDIDSFSSSSSVVERSHLRKRKPSRKTNHFALWALVGMLAVCATAFAIVMSRKPAEQAAQGEDSGKGKASGNPHAPEAATSSLDHSASPLRSSTPAKRSAEPPTTPGRPTTVQAADSSGKSKPPVVDSPIVDPPAIDPPVSPDPDNSPSPDVPRPAPSPEPETPQPQPKAKPILSAEEIDRRIAAAITPEDYQAVAAAALQSAAKAAEEHQSEAAKKLVLKALLTARKAEDSKLIIKATRALTNPELLKELSADDADLPSDP